MKTKKIIADSMPLALKMVRQQLGDNAIIVNTKSIKTGGIFGFFTKQKYEVTAYSIEKEGNETGRKFALELKPKPEKKVEEKSHLERKPEDVEKHFSVLQKKPQDLYSYYSQPTEAVEQHASSFSKPLEIETPLSSSNSVEKESELLEELQNMRKIMINFMIGEKQTDVLPAGLTKWVDRLKKHGVDEDVVEHIVNAMLLKHETITDIEESLIKKDILTIIEGIIERQIPDSHIVQEHTRMINVVGPTGVGKTTSIAKLATEQILKQKRRVAMITTDVYRIGAVEQLKTYAGILNVPIEIVRAPDELEEALSKLEHYDLIYMDTTGRNYKENRNRESINKFLNTPLMSDNYLVLSLTTKFEDMEILLNEFLDSPIHKLILTKFDETNSYGAILNIAYKYPYQLAYITNGQSVPEDITAIDATQVASYLLGEESENGSSTKPTRIYASI